MGRPLTPEQVDELGALVAQVGLPNVLDALAEVGARRKATVAADPAAHYSTRVETLARFERYLRRARDSPDHQQALAVKQPT